MNEMGIEARESLEGLFTPNLLSIAAGSATEAHLMSGIDLELIAVGVLLVALIATSIVGNILVCIAVATDNNLRKLSNLFLVSLAIADLLVAGNAFTEQLTKCSET